MNLAQTHPRQVTGWRERARQLSEEDKLEGMRNRAVRQTKRLTKTQVICDYLQGGGWVASGDIIHACQFVPNTVWVLLSALVLRGLVQVKGSRGSRSYRWAGK